MAITDLISAGAGMSLIVIIMTLCTLILIIANCCRFIFHNKIRRVLIILFYTFAFANAVILASDNIIREYALYFAEGETKTVLLSVCHGVLNALWTMTLACTFWVDGATMLHLGLSIKLAMEGINRRQIRCIYCITTIVSLACFICLSFLCYFYQGPKNHHRVRLAANSIILTINTCILIFLMRHLR